MPLSTPFVCGQASGSGDTLVIPVSVPAPRSSQPLGATFVFVYYQLDNDSTSTITGVSDDAPVDMEDGYSLCIFEDGLNHYDKDSAPIGGLIVNPLVDGVNNITLTFDTPTAKIEAVAIAVTGVGPDPETGWPFAPLDPSLTWWPGTLLAKVEGPVGAPTSTSTGPQWTYDSGGNVVISEPTGAAGVDSDWDWVDGQIAIYNVAQNNASADPGGWTWADGTLIDLAQWSVATGLGGPKAWMWGAIAYGSVSVGVAGPSVAGALADASSIFGAGGNGFALTGGTGPVCPSAPLAGKPCFNKLIPV